MRLRQKFEVYGDATSALCISTMNNKLGKDETPMSQEASERANNNEKARQCLKLISEIAYRGAQSRDPLQIGYALQELTQVLYERTGNDDPVFEPVSPSEISDLDELYTELDWVNCSAQDIMASAEDSGEGER